MIHPDHGELPISMLSDGVRSVISLVADLALRCVRLNPALGEQAPFLTPGVVLIDEVDLHLHPAWQQRIVSSLRQAFPEVQFILTTHSPQVLSTVHSSQIRVVDRDQDGRWQAVAPEAEVKGLESAVALSDVMSVDPVPDLDESRLVRRYTDLIEKGQAMSGDGVLAREQLEQLYGESSSVLIDADRLIRFQKFNERMAKKRSTSAES